MEHAVAIDLVLDDEGRVAGLSVGRVDASGALDVGVIETAAVVLATGGYGQAFASSTNPADVTGDGLALAARAGAELANVEFVQFHPTVLFVAGTRGQSPLITEALRGAGGVIVDDDGRSVMRGEHPLADLAPRDVVAYSMVKSMNQTGDVAHLWLDARGLGASRLHAQFPTTVSICRALGIDPSMDRIPIAPGAHYACGGVRADLDGRTSIAGLFAVGEVAATGVHGANRLASNSLTEAVVSGRRVGHCSREPRGVERTTPSVTVAPTRQGAACGRLRVRRSRRRCRGTPASCEIERVSSTSSRRLMRRHRATATRWISPRSKRRTSTPRRCCSRSQRCCAKRAADAIAEATSRHRTPRFAQPLVLRVVDGEIVTRTSAMADA